MNHPESFNPVEAQQPASAPESRLKAGYSGIVVDKGLANWLSQHPVYSEQTYLIEDTGFADGTYIGVLETLVDFSRTPANVQPEILDEYMQNHGAGLDNRLG